MRQRLRFAVPGAVMALTMACATSPSASPPAGANGSGTQEAADAEALAQALEQIDRIEVESNGGEYRIAADDLLEITVFDAPELSREVRVSSRGDVALPLVGSVPALGSTPTELAEELEGRLQAKYMRDPHVSVQLRETRSRPVYVLGEVERPGSFQFDTRDRITVLQAVAMGGGVGPLAAGDRAVLIRTSPAGERVEIPVNLDGALRGSMADMPMQPNDILFVPRSSARSVVRGVLGALTRIITLRAIF